MRRRVTMTVLASAIMAASGGVAHAATLEVGPGKTYATPCDAIAAAQPNDVVEVAAGTYTDTCSIGVKGLTVRGVSGRPKIDLSATEHPSGYKGIYVIDADDVTLDNLELTGAHISDDNGANGAGIRIQAAGLTVHGCYIHDNQNGILGGISPGGGKITIEYSEFAHNGLGNGCGVGGCTHNLYISHVDELVFQYNWSHDIASDTADKGHLLKSRALKNTILYNRITGEMGHDSYAVNLPNGGLTILVGNLIEKGPNGDNTILLSYGEEGASNPDKRIFLANNTFVNDASGGMFVKVADGTLVAHNNLFVGPGTVSSTGALSADNISGLDPMLVNQAMFDYHLQAASPVIDKGVDPGKADAFSLTPTDEYVHPLKGVKRKSDGKLDVGALEFGTDPNGMGGSGATGSSTTSAGVGVGGGSATGATGAGGASATGSGSASTGSGGAGGGGATGGSATGGCGCEVAGRESGSSTLALVGLGLAVAAMGRKRRQAR